MEGETEEDDEQPDCTPQPNTSVSNGEALRCSTDVWLKQQEEVNAYNFTSKTIV